METEEKTPVEGVMIGTPDGIPTDLRRRYELATDDAFRDVVFTQPERSIICLAALGLEDKEIASMLDLPYPTVRIKWQLIFERVRISSKRMIVARVWEIVVSRLT